MKTVNTEEIMNKIREDVKAERENGEPLTFADVNKADDIFVIPDKYSDNLMQKELANINGLWDTSLDKEILSNNGFKKFIKKFFRKIVMAVMNPHIEKQLAFNVSMVNGMNMLRCAVYDNHELKKEVSELKKRLDDLEKR